MHQVLRWVHPALVGTALWLLSGCGVGRGGFLSAMPTAPMFRTPAWQVSGLLAQYGDRISIRSHSPGGDVLLRHSRLGGVYRYEPRARRLVPVEPQEWDGAEGKVTECDRQFQPPYAVLRMDQRKEKLYAGNREISTAGRMPLRMRASPDEHRVAVLSADGWRGGSSFLLLIGGIGGFYGQHYHQIFSLDNFEPLGSPTRLSRSKNSETLLPCWSGDQRFVFYSDWPYYTLSVVHTNISGEGS